MSLNSEIEQAVRKAEAERRSNRCVFLALTGSFAISNATLGILTIWHIGVAAFGKQLPSLRGGFDSWLDNQASFALICIPFIGLPGLWWFVYCQNKISNDQFTIRDLIWILLLSVSIVSAFIGFFLGAVLEYSQDIHIVFMKGMLFFAPAMFGGAWIAWQAWRSVHPEEKFWPRFSLGTLLIVVIAWGALLAVFAPK